MPAERTYIYNGRFIHNLDNWTVSGASYSAGDGDSHYGVAELETGEYIEQTFSVPANRAYTLHIAIKSTETIEAGEVTIAITDSNANSLPNQEPVAPTASTWTELTYKIGLAAGTTYTIRITNASASAAVKVDDIWLYYVPYSRRELANRVHSKLGRLATERELSPAITGELSEGDYTYSVDAGLRSAGAINPETGEVDIRYLDESNAGTVLDLIERDVLERLHRDYAVETDVAIGPRRESLSQVAKALEALTGVKSGPGGGAGGTGTVVVRRLYHRAEDYEL